MADYYHLIKKAVSRLDQRATSESRLALYDRARAAQLAQLRAIDPRPSEAEIASEQRALEEAVRSVEADIGGSIRDSRIPELNDLFTAAEDIGKPVVYPKDRSPVARARDLASPLLPGLAIELPPPMNVRGGGTGRLVRYWRWRSYCAQSASDPASRR